MPIYDRSEEPTTPLQRLTQVRNLTRTAFVLSLPPWYRGGCVILDRSAWSADDYLVCLVRYGVAAGMSPTDFPYWVDECACARFPLSSAVLPDHPFTATPHDISTRGIALDDHLWSGGIGPGVLRTTDSGPFQQAGEALGQWLEDSEPAVLEYLNRPFKDGGVAPTGMYFETADNSLHLTDETEEN